MRNEQPQHFLSNDGTCCWVDSRRLFRLESDSSSEIRGLCLMKWPKKMLHATLFFALMNALPGQCQHHSQRQPGIKSDTKYEKYGRGILMEHFIKNKPLIMKSVYDKQIYLFFLVVGWILKFWSCWGCNFNSSPNWPRCENSTANQCVEAIWNFPRFRGGFSCTKWKFPGKWWHFSMFLV